MSKNEKNLKKEEIEKKREFILKSFQIFDFIEKNAIDNTEVNTMNTYLKRSLLQFFLQDDNKRETMIPMILELVGCNPQQISTAQRQWKRSKQLFAKTSGWFGL